MPVHKKFIKELTLYTLDEMIADPKLKKKLLEANKESEDFLDLSMKMDVEDLEAELESKGFQDVKIHWDLSYCQGSGVYFTFDGVNVFKLMKHEKSIYESAQKIKYLFKDWGRKLKQLYTYVGIKAIENHWANLNCHSKCVDIEFEYSVEEYTKGWEDTQSFKDFETDFKNLYQDLCSNIYNRLQKSLDYYESEEFLIEDLRCREPISYYLDTGQLYGPLEQNNSLIDNVTGFIYSENSYVIIDEKNRIFSYGKTQNPEDGDFIDASNEDDKGLSKAIIFSTANDANEFIVDTLIDNYSIMSVEQVFRKEDKNE